MSVVSLKGTPVEPAEPDAEIVEVLTDLLERAKAGEVRGIAFATVEKHATSTGCAGDGMPCAELTALVGLVHHVCLTLLVEDRGMGW